MKGRIRGKKHAFNSEAVISQAGFDFYQFGPVFVESKENHE
jgi:hypothetical protein